MTTVMGKTLYTQFDYILILCFGPFSNLICSTDGIFIVTTTKDYRISITAAVVEILTLRLRQQLVQLLHPCHALLMQQVRIVTILLFL